MPRTGEARKLRTSSESIGATAVVGACAALGAAAAAGDLGTASAFLPSLLRQCEEVASELRPFTEPAPIAAALAGAGT